MKQDKQELFYEIEQHLLIDQAPGIYLHQLLKQPIMKEEPFLMLYRLKQTMQSPKYHPEGDAWIHTCMVVDEAAKIKEISKDVRVFMWAALLHDIGKPDTTKMRKGRWTSYNHDTVGAKLAKEFLLYFDQEQDFVQKVASLVEFHMHILYVVKDMSFAQANRLKNETDVKEVALLGWCDRMGRTNANAMEEKENIQQFYDKMMR